MEKYGNDLKLLKISGINNYIPKKIDNTKKDINNIIEIYDIIKDLVDKNEQTDITDLIDISLNFSDENKFQIIHYLIENGINIAFIYAKRFNLDTSKIHLNLFMEGIKKGGDNLIFSDNFNSFIYMYREPIELRKQIGLEGYFEIYDYFILDDDNLGKIKKEDTFKAVKNYAKIYFNGKLLDKLNVYGIYDWDIILDNIFDDANYAKEIFFNLFILNKKEKQELKNMKVDFLNHDFFNDSKDLILRRENEDKSLYVSYRLEDNKKLDNTLNLIYHKLDEIVILKNGFNEFLVTFMDITGRVDNIELTSKMNNLLSNTNAFEDSKEFTNKFKKILSNYLFLLKESDFNFNILIFKSNGDKNDDDNKGINNIFYTGKKI